MITVILLAAGASRRMGTQDKLALDYEGQPMLEHTIRQLLAAQISDLIVVRPTAAVDFLPADLQPKLQIAVNPNPERGMTSSIKSGLPLVSPATTGIMIALADMPLLQTADYDQIITAFQSCVVNHPATIAVPFHADKKGNPVIFSAHFREALQNNPHPEGARLLIKAEWDNLCKVEMATRAVLLDVDTPEDYRKL